MEGKEGSRWAFDNSSVLKFEARRGGEGELGWWRKREWRNGDKWEKRHGECSWWVME